MHRAKHAIGIMALMLAAAGLVACGNVSRNIARDDSGAHELAWPSPDQATILFKGGTYPGLVSLQQIHAGMDEHRIASLVGYPQFHEGAWGMREWNYVFHLPTTDGGDRLCQYKVLFDKDRLARDFYWKPASCADLLKTPASGPAVASITSSTDGRPSPGRRFGHRPEVRSQG